MVRGLRRGACGFRPGRSGAGGLPRPARRSVWRRRVLAALALAGFLYGVFGVLIPSWFLVLGPGPAPDVSELVVAEVSGAPAPGDVSTEGAPEVPARGRFLLTTVLAAPAGPLELLRAARDPTVDVVPRWRLIPPGLSDEAYAQWGEATMDESQLMAAWQAWTFLDNECELVSDGVRVFGVSRASPAAGHVDVGDVIVSWSLGSMSARVVLGDDLERGVREAFAGALLGDVREALSLTVRRSGSTVTKTLLVSGDDLVKWPFLGLTVAADGLRTVPDIPVSFAPGDIGGPSGGLMLALQIVDDFTPGDLTSGRVIAGSGTIQAGGAIGAVGGIDKKIHGAVAEGAGVFLVPKEDYPQAYVAMRREGVEGVDLMPVGSLEEAYQALLSLTRENGDDYNRADLPPGIALVTLSREAEGR